MEWHEIIGQTGIGLILGDLGKGKSALGYYLLETLGKHYNKPKFVYGLPKEKIHLVPRDIKPIYDLDFPEGSIVLIDESYLHLNSRSSMKSQNKFINKLMGLVRQKRILCIYISPTSRRLDIGVVSAVQFLIIKKPSLLAVKFDRTQLRGILEDVLRKFKRIPEEEQKKNAYVISSNKEGFLTNPLPHFWSEELSCVFSGVKITEEAEPPQEAGDIEVPKGKINLKCSSCNKNNELQYPEKCKHCGGFIASKPVFKRLSEEKIKFSF